MRQVNALFMMLVLGACAVFNYEASDMRQNPVDWAEIEAEITVTRESRPEMCARLYPSPDERWWDDEDEVYLPINVDWENCMGVGRQ